MLILRLAVALCAGEVESLTLTVKEEVPAVVGVPLIWPDVHRVRPAVREPELSDQLYGVLPPLAESVAEYGLLVCALDSDEVVICTGATEAAMVIVRLAVALCTGEVESLTFTVNDEVPAAVGVPLICPELPRVSPAGREPELSDQLYGVVPPLAASEAE